MATLNVRLTGTAPLLLHNGSLADPMNQWALDIKKVSGKRKKTIEDHQEMARLEFLGSLYLDESGRICIPGENLEAMFIKGAMKHKMGPQAKTALFIMYSPRLEYNGPKDPNALYKNGGFIDRRGCVVSRARIMRTRPSFREWALNVEIKFNDTILDKSDLITIVETAGVMIGLGDYRPKFGRFEAEILTPAKAKKAVEERELATV